MKGRIVGLGLVLFILVFSAACSGTASEAGNVILMGPYYFDPSELTVAAGSEVTLTLKNVETFQGEPHEWTLMEAGYKVEAPFSDEDRNHTLTSMMVHPNSTGTLTFTAPSEPGEYQIVCSVPDHLEQGHPGKLIVTP